MATGWRSRTLDYVDSLKLDTGAYRLFAGGDESLYGTCFALMAKHYLGDFDDVDPTRLIHRITSYQDEKTGFFIGPELRPDELGSKHTWDHVLMHLTAHVLPTLELLGAEPRFPLVFLKDYKDLASLNDWLHKRDFRDAWYEGNYLMFVGQFLVHEAERGDAGAARALTHWFDWLDERADPETGMWGTDGLCSRHNGLFGAYHQFIIYRYVGRPIRHFDRVVDTAIGCSDAIGKGACEDVDVIDILVGAYETTDYRREEVAKLLGDGVVERILACQNGDGGFVYARGGGPFSMMGIARTARPMSTSHLFPTWFRAHTLALLQRVVDDPRLAGPFNFNGSCSMGWHGGPVFRPANHLSQADNTMGPEQTDYRGQNVTLVRKSIMQFLEGWAPLISGKVLDVGAGNWGYARRLFDHCEYLASDVSADFNVDIVLDLLNPPDDALGAFDAVICTDVLEHVADPAGAVAGAQALLKPGGLLLLTTPFNYELHGTDSVRDYWRITGDGLRLLLGQAGFRRLTIDHVGHENAPLGYFVSAHKPGAGPGSEAGSRPAHEAEVREPVLLSRQKSRVGGPTVKLGRLSQYFKQDDRGFNIVYTVSDQIPPDACRELQQDGKRVVLNCPGVYFPAYRPNYGLMNEPLGELHRLADYVIYQTAFSREAAQAYLGSRGDKTDIVYNAVDFDHFAVPARPGDRFNILVAGNHYIRHRIEPLIQAMPLIRERFPKAELIIAGPLSSANDGNGDVFSCGKPDIDELCRRHGVEYTHIESYSQDEAPRIYARGDILVHLKHMDWCPNVVLEAMSTGLPVVHTGNGGTPELVGDAGASLDLEHNWDSVPDFDLRALAGAVAEAFERRSELGRRAREIVVDRFGIERWVRRHRSIFEEVLRT